jgi:hypothetical protein
LVISANREVIEGLIVKKLPVQIDVPIERLNLEPLRAAARSATDKILGIF